MSYNFEVTNRGSTPLMIVWARARCGCTRPEFPKQPIRPGEKGYIKVTYVPKNRPGSFDKSVEVRTSNNTEVIRVRGNVIPAMK